MVNFGALMSLTASMLGQQVSAADSKAKCIKVTPDKDAAWGKHDWYYPEGYGKTCGSTSEPGSFHCTRVKDPNNASAFLPHEFKRDSKGYNKKMDSQSWCTNKWCLVDPCKCNNSDIAKSSWYDGYYSYSMCGSKDEYTAGACTTMGKADCEKNPTCKWGTDCKPRTFSEMMTAKRKAAGCSAAAANVSGCACLGSHKEPVVACPTTRDWLWGTAPVTPATDKASIASTSTPIAFILLVMWSRA